MAAIYEIYMLSEKILQNGIEREGLSSTLYPDEAMKDFDKLLSKHGQTAYSFFLDSMDISFRKLWWPWATIAFPNEYNIAHHVKPIREEIDGLRYSRLSWTPGQSFSQDSPLSILFFKNKSSLKQAKDMSELFSCAWSLLKNKEENRRWLVLSDDPDKKWLQHITR